MPQYTQKHRAFLEKLGTSLEKLKKMSPTDRDRFTDEVLVSYICGAGTKEEEDLADDIIDLMKDNRKSREDYKRIAADTVRDIKCGYYVKGGKKYRFNDLAPWGPGYYYEAKVLSPEKLESINRDDDDFFSETYWASQNCGIYLVDADSFEAASSFNNPLVMNFASAKHPGGGFLNGASAQEESLCRCSTLYASLSSVPAREMYDFNKRNDIPGYSDYMILSPNVCVYKNTDGEYLDEPFTCAVMSVAAPNLRREAGLMTEDEIRDTIKYRLKLFLKACARNMHRELVLGAWGCGAFGNDPKMVAECFHELLCGEHKLCQLFDNIVFAVYGGGRNYDAFAEVFGDDITDCAEPVKAEEMYDSEIAESAYHRPVCNHSPANITEDNIGYTFGILPDGVPFEAEKWTDGDSTSISVYLPDLNLQGEEAVALSDNCNVIPFERTAEQKMNAILCTDMVIREPDITQDAKPYVDYLEKAGLITFTEAVRNGGFMLLTDEEGNDIVCVTVTLEGVYNGHAETSLHFRDFPGAQRKKKPVSKILKFPKQTGST